MRAVREKRLVFIDESFCKTGMRREFGWALRGKRVVGTRPFRSWKTISIIGAIRLGTKPNNGAANLRGRRWSHDHGRSRPTDRIKRVLR